MPSRVLETVLTGRNLLSPVLTGAAADVSAFDAKVAASQEKASTSAETNARAQTTAADRVVAANARTAASSSDASAKVTAANARTAESASASSAKVVESNARSAESMRAFADVSESSAARSGVALGSLATKGPVVATAVVAAMAVVTGKMAGDYQQLVTKLETTAGESKANLATVSQGMLDMAGQVGISADELAKGMYVVESAGFHGAAGLNVLKAGAQGAVQEQADLSHVVDAVTTSLHDYHLPASDAAKVTSELVTAVSHGKTTFDDLTGAMHSIEPVAVGANQTIAQTAGALSAMTASGMHADQAAQNLAHTIGSFQNATKPMRDELSQLGLDATDLQMHMGERGIAGTLQLVSDAIVHKMGPAGQIALSALNTNKTAVNDLSIMIGKMPPQLADLAAGLLEGTTSQGEFKKASAGLGAEAGAMADQFLASYKGADGFSAALKSGGPMVQTYISALAKATGTTDGLRTALMLTGENAPATNAAIADIGKAAGDSQGNIKGWAEVQSNLNQKLAEAGAEAKSLAIEAGQHLLPVLTGIVGWVGDTGLPGIKRLGSGIGDLVHDFSELPGPVQTAAEVLAGLALANAIGLFSKLGDQIVYARVLMLEFADTTRASMGQVSAAYAEAAAAARLSASIQGESMASTNIVGALAGTTAAAKTLATAGFGAIRSGASGLMSMFGGPWGIAMMAATVGIMSIKSALDEQAAAEKAAYKSGEELYNTYVKLGTVYGQQADAARETVKQQNGLNDIAQRAGISQDTLTQALEGNAAAQKKVTDATGSMGDRWNSLWSGSFGDFLSGNFLTKDKDVWKKVADGLGQDATNMALFQSSTDDTKGALQDYQDTANRIFGPKNLANQGVSTLQKGMDELATSSGDTQKSLQGISDILAGLTGKGVSAAQATVDLTTATIDTSKAFAQMTKGALDNKGAIDLTSEAGVGLWNSLKDVSSGYKTAVNDAYNSALATGTATDASHAAGDAAQKLYDKFILTATGAGMSRDAAEKLAKQLGLVPGDIVTQFTTPGLGAAQAGVNILQGQINVITSGPHDVTVTALTQTAEDALTAVGVHVTHLPDGTVNISADTYAAQSALDNFLIRNATHVITVGIAGRNDAAYTGSSIIVNGKVVANADGNLLGASPMAASMAQVVPPGTLRVIGDNPVADEAFIPINNSARSLAILAETAARMGLGLTAMANGGFVGIPGAWPAGGTSTHVDINPNALHDKIGATLTAMVTAVNVAQAASYTSAGGNAGNRALGQSIANAMGVGGQFSAIDYVFSRESGWNNNAQNPSSTAYGIPQFLASTWAQYGGRTSDPATQIRDGILYMENRYGSPNGAAAFWAAHHWYGDGGIVTGPQLAVIGEAGPEAIVPLSKPGRRDAVLAQAGIGYNAAGTGFTAAAAPGYSTPAAGRAAAPTQVNVSFDGARITGRLELGTDGVATLVDARIDATFGEVHDTVHYAGS